MSIKIGASLGRFGPVRLGVYTPVSRNAVEDIGFIALGALLVFIALDVVKVIAWLVYEILLLCWRAGRATVRWAIRRERAHKAAIVVAGLGAALAFGSPAPAHADPGDPGIDPSDTCTLLYCPPPRYSGWGDGAADCNYVLGHWQASNGYPCRVDANP